MWSGRLVLPELENTMIRNKTSFLRLFITLPLVRGYLAKCSDSPFSLI